MARRVGILGLGIMGSAMAANLLRAGFEVIGYDPVAARPAGSDTGKRVESLPKARRTWAALPAS
jgi:putative dehydrogenase